MNTKPNPNNVIIDDRNGTVAVMVSELTKAMRTEIDRATRTCLNCEYFDEPNELCGKWNARPPARIIATGCADHQDDIPF